MISVVEIKQGPGLAESTLRHVGGKKTPNTGLGEAFPESWSVNEK